MISRIVKALLGLIFLAITAYAINLFFGFSDIGKSADNPVKVEYVISSNGPVSNIRTDYTSISERNISKVHSSTSGEFSYILEVENWKFNAGHIQLRAENSSRATYLTCEIIVDGESIAKETFDTTNSFTKENSCSSFFFNN